MLISLCLVVFMTLVASQYDFTGFGYQPVPMYVQRALRRKENYRQVPHAKKKTLTNLTLHEVFTKIRDITMALNRNAKKNGFKVDYKFRILE